MRKKRMRVPLLLAAAVVLFAAFFPLPYYVTRPGMAKELDSVVHVENGDRAEGKFFLTTVRMGRATIITYLMAKFQDYSEILPLDSVRLENETDEEYNVRQLYYMEESKENAIQAAFKAAGESYEVRHKGVYVLGVVKGMPAEGVLQAGDRIIAVDGKTFDSSDRFISYVQSKKEGDKITVTFLRKGKEHRKKILVRRIPELNKPGIGITLVEDKEVKTKRKVTIDTEEIGGPSAGLMFTLEIYNQLTKGDLTKGYRIAGTGTIESDGKVGPIGGVDQKVVAADKEGAEIFFAPNENGKRDSDYQMAVETAKRIGSKMKIVPVDTLSDALAYLESLPEK
ncbi:SepM family pheromone-processing serine protease [Caldibacillus debilis]|uniref:SepM family pheromone-processing serine protease n=1 Tax=Caldibacillus debilis TaxID=301148 RepID=UPI00037D51F1|nr:SepM family pheromone-processing serine protease [Caldibacillus debilis]